MGERRELPLGAWSDEKRDCRGWGVGVERANAVEWPLGRWTGGRWTRPRAIRTVASTSWREPADGVAVSRFDADGPKDRPTEFRPRNGREKGGAAGEILLVPERKKK